MIGDITPASHVARRRAEAWRRRAAWTAAASTAVAAVILIGCRLAIAMLWAFDRGSLAPQLEAVQEARARLAALRAEHAELRARVDAVDRLRDTEDWSAPLAFFALAAPEGMTLRSLRLEAAELHAGRNGSISVLARGLAPGREAVATFVARLQRTPEIGDVELDRLTAGPDGAAFDLRCTLRAQSRGEVLP